MPSTPKAEIRVNRQLLAADHGEVGDVAEVAVELRRLRELRALGPGILRLGAFRRADLLSEPILVGTAAGAAT